MRCQEGGMQLDHTEKKMDSGTQQAASLTITVTRAVLPKIMLCKLEWRPNILKDAREHGEGMVSLSKAKFFLPKCLYLAKRLQTQIYLKEIYYKNGKHSLVTQQKKGLRTAFHS